MDVIALPFNLLIGMEPGAARGGFLVSLPAGTQYTNHIGTVHASALLALAEAASGVFLSERLETHSAEFIPLVRRVEAKFRRPATGRVSARATVAAGEVQRWASEMATRGRVLAGVTVEVVDESGSIILNARIEWFIARKETKAG